LGYHSGLFETGSNKLYIDNSDTSTPLIYGEFDTQKVVINGTLKATSGIIFPDGTTQTSGLTGLTNAGSFNAFLGNMAGHNNTSGGSNTFLGSFAGSGNTTGYRNTSIGEEAGAINNGYSNVFIGVRSGGDNVTGYKNTIIGFQAGDFNQQGFGNVFLGYAAGATEMGSNKLYIDNSETSTPLIYGEFDTNKVVINGTLTATTSMTVSDERWKKNIEPLESSLEKVMHLQGVSYDWKADEYPDRGFTKDRQIGLIAQEVEKVIPELVQTDSKGYKAISYEKLVPVLLEAIKEQQKEISELKKQQAMISSLSEKVAQLESELKLRGNLALAEMP